MFGGRKISNKDKNGYPISGMGGQVPVVQPPATAAPAPAPAAAKPTPAAEKPKKKWYQFW